MFQLLHAVSHAHFKNVMHRDIKPENILVMNPNNPTTLTIKLADWGSSRYLERSSTSNQKFTVEVIPLPYRPP
jgi:serine/threonine-protein kinase